MQKHQMLSPVVGVPKREPCQKCGNPVFLAERLSVGRALYHRTCLRCARCNSQLTLGSFYETETDGVFCCETCPDEETNNSEHNEQSCIAASCSGQDTVDDYLQMDPTRKSFSEKLAMFQTNDKVLLQKSLSDEEKSKSLQRLSEMYARTVSTTLNDNTLNASTDAATEKPTVFGIDGVDDGDDNNNNESDSSSETESENCEPSSTLDAHETVETPQAPPIPLKPPPIASKANVLSKIYGSAVSPSPIMAMQCNVPINENDTQQVHHSTIEYANDMPIANRNEELSASQAQASIANSSNFSNLDKNNEISRSQFIAQKDFPALDESNKQPSNHQQQGTSSNVTKDETTNSNESVEVSAVIADGITPNHSISTEINSISVASKRHADSETSAQIDAEASRDNRPAAANDPIELVVTSTIAESERNTTEQDDAIATTPSKPVPVKRAIIPAASNDGNVQPPTPMRRKNVSNVVAAGEEDSSLAVGDERNSNESKRVSVTPTDKIASSTPTANLTKHYPTELNPFGDSDVEDKEVEAATAIPAPRTEGKLSKLDNSNPFDSSDDEIELLKETLQKATERKPSAARISTNPFGSDTEDEDGDRASTSSKRTPVPTPRKILNVPMPSRNSSMYGSITSLTSTTPRRKKCRAPAAPVGAAAIESKPSSLQHSAASSPSHSNRATPMLRKKRPAPLPPPKSLQANELSASMLYMTARTQLNHSFGSCSTLALDDSINPLDFSLQSNDSMSGATQYITTTSSLPSAAQFEQSQRKLIPIDASLLDDMPSKSLPDFGGDENVCYRRTIVPTELDCASTASATIVDDQQQSNDRQWEKMKQNKESQNKNRQSQTVVLSPTVDTELPYNSNKSSYGKWKRRKGPAPSLPIPPRKVLQMLPLEDIRHELEVIEVQQQGLEKQGVQLEKMIRERCEGGENDMRPLDEFKPNTKEVEDLILQLFELVNEKNELFRRQAELMYLRRQHRLEQEQADIEYEIRVLMAQPECNKTDSDKSREETLISRLLEVVQLRNEVIESLEMDRRREAEEDQSIKERMEMHTAQRDKKLTQPRSTKLSKKEKKKQKESKKLAKLKKIDADKDADESEVKLEHSKEEKKKKKKFLF